MVRRSACYRLYGYDATINYAHSDVTTATSRSFVKKTSELPAEMAQPGINRFVCSLLGKPKKQTTVLVLGSGNGLLEKHLEEQGFISVYSVDLFSTPQVPTNSFLRLDLNNPTFAKNILERWNKKFDIIVAVEVIEHLASSDNFLRNVESLLASGGKAFFSTPNIHSALARVEYLVTGYPTLYFHPPSRGDHINPIFDRIITHIARENGLRITKINYYDSIRRYLRDYPRHGIRSWIYIYGALILSVLLRPFMRIERHTIKGLSKVFTVQKITRLK